MTLKHERAGRHLVRQRQAEAEVCQPHQNEQTLTSAYFRFIIL